MPEPAQGALLTARTTRSIDGRAGRLKRGGEGDASGKTRIVEMGVEKPDLTFAHEPLKTFVGLHDAVQPPLHVLREADEGVAAFEFEIGRFIFVLPLAIASVLPHAQEQGFEPAES